MSKSKEFMESVVAIGVTGLLASTAIKYATAPESAKAESIKKPTVSSKLEKPVTTKSTPEIEQKDPHQITVNSRLSRSSAEKLFGVDLQETVVLGNSASDPTATEVKGIKHVAYVIGKNSYGWGEQQDSCLSELWTNESNWRGNAYNNATATGIPQALWKLHGPKIEDEFPDFQDNVVQQVQWGEEYIAARYGNPCNANYQWHHNYDSNGHHWY